MSFLQKVTIASRRSSYRLVVAALSVLLATGTFWSVQQHAAAVRFINRGLYINSSIAGDTTFYTVTFTYPTVNTVGSVRLLFCDSPIPSLPCVTPSGLDVSNVVLSTQTGETGFTIGSQTTNSVILTRPPVTTSVRESKYTFSNVVNPSSIGSFYIRLNSYTSTTATGPHIDYGSVASSTALEMGIETQVPPILIFCTGREIPTLDCADAQGPNFEDFGQPEPEDTMVTKSEMMAYTNARNGYVITYAGRGLTSGTHEIPVIEGDPETSIPGKGQFGINLAVNTDPVVGAPPVGPATNTTVNPDYATPNMFQFNPGEILVTSDFVTLNRKFTVSYIINFPPDQHPGVYNTTVTFICTGNF